MYADANCSPDTAHTFQFRDEERDATSITHAASGGCRQRPLGDAIPHLKHQGTSGGEAGCWGSLFPGRLLGAAASPAERTQCTPVVDSLGATPVAERAGGEDSVVVI